jgi:hypothetical protein
MTCFDARSLATDIEGLAFLQDVLETSPADSSAEGFRRAFDPALRRAPVGETDLYRRERSEWLGALPERV